MEEQLMSNFAIAWLLIGVLVLIGMIFFNPNGKN